ncbi:pyruvate/2-oxoglutarate dehydrogenase complex, dihydrolipoamide dehydrogenase component [Rivularia sp. PCC 7116]|uniref:dihydrolipoyl dehydrogenase family protein n=1 Tax=Rivularia sp. PCC 7116 TaxID=373994 RepID=UPI00029F3C0E|nr:NAD(P)/FAD-dependent oxidoreductase [Rivularia sp. PCC 7116]AFY53270.1 pyruvate/2-oxoglutarate dehydrogenase complex, dihydrolipoamide dehydrogenase component [Rivularia sp. PCC 7116]
MSVDYDIVIIGGSFVGRDAALKAVQQRAKVALVEPRFRNELIQLQGIGEVGKVVGKINNLNKLGFLNQAQKKEKFQIPLDKTILWGCTVAANINEQLSPAFLTGQGVDVIVGSGNFQASPDLCFIVNNRKLIARRFLLATGSIPAIPDIEGLRKTGFLTLLDIWQVLESSTPPKSWVILGGTPQSVEIAQSLARLGYEVTFITNSPYIISPIDREVAQLLQAQLEVDGVRVLTQTTVSQIRFIGGKKWLQAGDTAIETDEILVAVAEKPFIKSFNLAAVGVKYNSRSLLVDQKLQTTNRRIYACGDVIGGYNLPNIADYEAKIAIKNALLFPKYKINYRAIPWGILTQPGLAQVGLTQRQAKNRYGKNDILILRQYFKVLATAQLTDETTGICKIIVRRNGEILGASLLGAEARELINVIALAIAEKIKINKLADLSPVYSSFSEIIEQTAWEWSKQKFESRRLQDFWDGLFYFLRSRG